MDTSEYMTTMSSGVERMFGAAFFTYAPKLYYASHEAAVTAMEAPSGMTFAPES
jgi:hypothetical protein